MGRYRATTWIGRDGIFLGSDNVTVEQNVIHDIGRYAPGESGCTNSLYYRTDDHAIYVAGANYVIIRNNIFYRNQHGWSVHIYPNPVNNLSVLNDTFAVPNAWEPGYRPCGRSHQLATPIWPSIIISPIRGPSRTQRLQA
jgi:hypothetical protein